MKSKEAKYNVWGSLRTLCVTGGLCLSLPVAALASPSSMQKSDDNFNHSRIVKSFDSNQDGKLTEQEFVEYHKHQFERFDKNSDGSLSSEEQRQLTQSWNRGNVDSRVRLRDHYSSEWDGWGTSAQDKNEKVTLSQYDREKLLAPLVGVVEYAVNADMEAVVDYLSNEDRDRMFWQSTGDTDRLEEVSERIRDQWEESTGVEFEEGFGEAHIPYRVIRINEKEAEIELLDRNKKKNHRVRLVNEGWFSDAWKIALPNDKQAKTLTQDISEALAKSSSAGKPQQQYDTIALNVINSITSKQ